MFVLFTSAEETESVSTYTKIRAKALERSLLVGEQGIHAEQDPSQNNNGIGRQSSWFDEREKLMHRAEITGGHIDTKQEMPGRKSWFEEREQLLSSKSWTKPTDSNSAEISAYRHRQDAPKLAANKQWINQRAHNDEKLMGQLTAEIAETIKLLAKLESERTVLWDRIQKRKHRQEQREEHSNRPDTSRTSNTCNAGAGAGCKQAKSVQNWTRFEVAKWLSSISIAEAYGKYSREFLRHNIDGTELLRETFGQAALEECGVVSGLHQRLIMREIWKLREDSKDQQQLR
jgi:hypothetical protein